MTVITSSNATLGAHQAGSWFTPAGTVFAADVDSGDAILQVRRDVSDTAPKTLFLPTADGLVKAKLHGPISVMVQNVVGRQYRFTALTTAAVVAGDE